MQKILLLAISFLILSCGQESKKESSDTKNQDPKVVEENAGIGRNNYAIVWQWSTDDVKLVEDNLSDISNQFMGLWEKDLIENAYFNSGEGVEKLANYGNMAFFVKAQSKSEAKSILDTLIVVRKGISTYHIHPVGTLWLDKKTDNIQKKENSKAFVTVWTTQNNLGATEELLKAQNDKIVSLWNEGVVENVYFDIEGTKEKNEKTDFVFFVNASSKEEAEKICNELPFSKENIASYKMLQAGLFWIGRNQK